jgi:hypothetical protein
MTKLFEKYWKGLLVFALLLTVAGGLAVKNSRTANASSAAKKLAEQESAKEAAKAIALSFNAKTSTASTASVPLAPTSLKDLCAQVASGYQIREKYLENLPGAIPASGGSPATTSADKNVVVPAYHGALTTDILAAGKLELLYHAIGLNASRILGTDDAKGVDVATELTKLTNSIPHQSEVCAGVVDEASNASLDPNARVELVKPDTQSSFNALVHTNKWTSVQWVCGIKTKEDGFWVLEFARTDGEGAKIDVVYAPGRRQYVAFGPCPAGGVQATEDQSDVPVTVQQDTPQASSSDNASNGAVDPNTGGSTGDTGAKGNNPDKPNPAAGAPKPDPKGPAAPVNPVPDSKAPSLPANPTPCGQSTCPTIPATPGPCTTTCPTIPASPGPCTGDHCAGDQCPAMPGNQSSTSSCPGPGPGTGPCTGNNCPGDVCPGKPGNQGSTSECPPAPPVTPPVTTVAPPPPPPPTTAVPPPPPTQPPTTVRPPVTTVSPVTTTITKGQPPLCNANTPGMPGGCKP